MLTGCFAIKSKRNLVLSDHVCPTEIPAMMPLMISPAGAIPALEFVITTAPSPLVKYAYMRAQGAVALIAAIVCEPNMPAVAADEKSKREIPKLCCRQRGGALNGEEGLWRIVCRRANCRCEAGQVRGRGPESGSRKFRVGTPAARQGLAVFVVPDSLSDTLNETKSTR
jgi:hypothetical protein